MKKEIFIRGVEIETGSSPIPAAMLRDLRRADQFIQLAALVGSAAMAPDAVPSHDPLRTGIFLGTTIGPLETNFLFLDSLLDNGESQASPTLFTHSVHNTAAGYVSRILDLQGVALTVTTPGWPFLAALAEAKTALENRGLDEALVLAVEEDCFILVDARERERRISGQTPTPHDQATPLRRGAIAWMLTTNADENCRSPRLCEIMVEENHAAADFYLYRQHELFAPAPLLIDRERTPRSLDAPMSLSLAMAEARRLKADSLSWKVTAPCGRASVLIEL